ncbi:MAG: Ig-like domain-containing protein, partial [Verrucomicrobiota bacterium]
MKSVRIHPRLRLWFSRLSSLLLLFQRSPIIQLIFPEAKILGGSAVLDTATFAIATVVGLGAFDSVAGATTVVQKTPVANSTTFNATVGVAITGATAFVYGVSSTNTPAYFQLTSGSVPPGLTKGSTISNKTQSITGTPTTAGTYSITLKAWESWNNTTMTGSGGSALGTFSIVVAAAGSTPPTVVVSPTGTLTKGSPLTFTLLFSQAVSGLTTSGIAVTNGTLGTLSGSGASYTIPVTPTGQGAVTCQVKASAATNATSNPNTVSNTASVTYDSLAPTVNVSPSGTLTKGSPLTFTLLFSEP